jgi:hypothetical protein
VRNNPLKYVDPSGHRDLDPNQIGVGGGGTGVGIPPDKPICCRSVTVYAFRGFGGRTDDMWEKVGDREKSYNPLLRNGHVGIQLDGKGPIWGFTPDISGSQSWTKEEWDLWQASLPEDGWSSPGSVKDDTRAFQQARRVSSGARMVVKGDDYFYGEVYVRSYQVDTQEYANIETAITMGRNGGLTYSFPNRDSGAMTVNCNNCATYVYQIMSNGGVENTRRPPWSGQM